MAEMYGSYSDEALNEWERMPQNIRVLTSSAFGAWLLRRDKRVKEQEPKIGHWEPKYPTREEVIYCQERYFCSNCKGFVVDRISRLEFKFCPNCGCRIVESEDKE